MESLLSFFSDIILITAGILVCLLWIALFAAVGIEVWDGITGNDKDSEEEELN